MYPADLPVRLFQSRMNPSASGPSCDLCTSSALIFVSIVSLMSTTVPPSPNVSRKSAFGLCGSSFSSRQSSGNIWRVEASGLIVRSATYPAAMWSGWLM